MPHCIKGKLCETDSRVERNARRGSKHGYHLIIYDIRSINHSTNEKFEELIFG